MTAKSRIAELERRLADVEKISIARQRELNQQSDRIAELHTELQEAWDDGAFWRARSGALQRRVDRYRPKKKAAKKVAKKARRG